MKAALKRLTAKATILALVIGALSVIPMESAGKVSAQETTSSQESTSSEGGTISWEKSGNETIITVTPEKGYELKAGSLIALNRYGEEYVPTRVGFQKTEDAGTYTVKEASVVITDVQGAFIQPTADEPNIGNVDTVAATDSYGVRLISRINRTVEGDGEYLTLGDKKVLIKDYGVILTTKDVAADGTELTAKLAADNPRVRKVSVLESDIRYDSCENYVDISVLVKNTNKMDGATRMQVLSRPYVELDDGRVLYGEQGSTTYREVSGITEPKNIVLTTGNAYPEWIEKDGAVKKIIKVPVTDMTGADAILTLNNADEITVIPGKLYGVTYRADDGTAALRKCQFQTWRARMTEKNEDTGELTIVRGGVTYNLKLAKDAYTCKVTLGEAPYYRLSNAEKGIGEVTITGSGGKSNAIYNTDELGKIAFILTTTNGATAYNSVYGANDLSAGADTPDVAAPTFETAPVAFVTKAPYLKNGKYVVDLKDIFGKTYEAKPFDYTAVDYPMVNLPYKVTFKDDGTALLEKLTTSMTRAVQGDTYAKGVLTGSNNTYTITADTYIFYVTRKDTAGNKLKTLTLVDPADVSQKLKDADITQNVGITAHKFNIIQSNNMKAPGTSGGFVQWMMVEVTGETLYPLTDTAQNWYTASTRPTRMASELMLMTSDIKLDATGKKYLIDAVDMNGDSHSLEYTKGESGSDSGIIPVKGKVFLVTTTENGIVKFTWPSSVVNVENYKDGNKYYDLVRAKLSAYDAEKRTVTLNDSKEHKLAADVKILGVSQLNSYHFAEYERIKEASELMTSDKYNTIFGQNSEGEIVWILNCDKSIYNIADKTNYTAPALPTETGTQ